MHKFRTTVLESTKLRAFYLLEGLLECCCSYHGWCHILKSAIWPFLVTTSDQMAFHVTRQHGGKMSQLFLTWSYEDLIEVQLCIESWECLPLRISHNRKTENCQRSCILKNAMAKCITSHAPEKCYAHGHSGHTDGTAVDSHHKHMG